MDGYAWLVLWATQYVFENFTFSPKSKAEKQIT